MLHTEAYFSIDSLKSKNIGVHGAGCVRIVLFVKFPNANVIKVMTRFLKYSSILHYHTDTTTIIRFCSEYSIHTLFEFVYGLSPNVLPRHL